MGKLRWGIHSAGLREECACDLPSLPCKVMLLQRLVVDVGALNLPPSCHHVLTQRCGIGGPVLQCTAPKSVNSEERFGNTEP